MKIAKKDSDAETVTYKEALEAALCFGWIDGQKKAYDEIYWLQKFTRRAERSIWSKNNRAAAEELIKAGRMKPPGFKAIEAAKKNNRWETAYEPQGSAGIPDDLQAALDKNSEAKKFFETLKGANRYAVLFRISTAKKTETRKKRIEKFVAMLEKHETIYP